MLTQRDLDTWDELETEVRGLAEQMTQEGAKTIGHVSHLLYRGHASHGWSLDTTLQRRAPSLKCLSDYYRLVSVIKPQIETFTDRLWPEINYPEIVRECENYDFLRLSHFPAYEYLVYLRHHGFPSPLLDWSRSLYVAAFFALQKPIPPRVAIFVYQEYAGGGKLSSSDKPQIHTLGPNMRTHQRHFLQQGEYTTSVHYRDGSWQLATHSEVFQQGHEQQDKLWKFTIPVSEAPHVIRRLDEYNINAFSLFQGEEALLSTLAERHIKTSYV